MSVQMNIRIDETLKARGDAVFDSHGITPSQAVRSLWEYVSRAGNLPRFVTNGSQNTSIDSQNEYATKIQYGSGLALKLTGSKHKQKSQVTPSLTENSEVYASMLDAHYAEKYPDLFAANE
jgi:addiction module RelB/DinJ family antitoxin